jgi:cell shape-determining protein MreC
MARKRTNISRGTLFAWGMLVGLTLLFSPKSLTGRLQLTYAQVFRWPLEAGRGLTLAARTASRTPDVDREEYQQLLTAQRQLKNELANVRAKLREALQTNEQLAGLRVDPAWKNVPLLEAGVTVVAGQAQNELVINRGRDHGAAVGQYVMSPTDRCIIGTISDVSAKGAIVRLITDPDSRIPVSVAGPGVRGFMEGRGDGTARIPLIPDKYTIRPGDRVYAEKVQGLLDVPVVVAEVVQCKRDSDSPTVWDITVRPVCDPAGLRDVAVVIPAAGAL